MYNPARGYQQLWQRIVSLVGIAHLRTLDDSGDQQVAQLEIRAGGPDGVNEVIDKVPRLGDYGFASCPPAGSEGVALFLGGQRSMPLIVGTGHKASRLKNLKSGEAALYNGLTSKRALVRQDGVLHYNGDAAVDGDLDVGGDIDVTGDANVTGSVVAAHVKPNDGATGVFHSQDGKTITVTNGIITHIV